MSVPVIIANGLAWFLVWLFAQAAVHKLGAPQYYRQLMTRYAGYAGGGIAVWLVAALEMAIAVALLLPQWRAPALVAAALMLLGYAMLMARQILVGKADMQCGCAGPDSALGISWSLVVRNGVCATLALLAMSAGGSEAGGWAGVALSLCIAVFLSLFYLTSEQVISNAQWMAGDS